MTDPDLGLHNTVQTVSTGGCFCVVLLLETATETVSFTKNTFIPCTSGKSETRCYGCDCLARAAVDFQDELFVSELLHGGRGLCPHMAEVMKSCGKASLMRAGQGTHDLTTS